MKSTGIVRLVDELGRIVLPMELRRTLGIDIGDSMEFFVDDASRKILIRKYRGGTCYFCSSSEQLVYFKEKLVCGRCWSELTGEKRRKVQIPGG
ncbi:AbrB/MazE/SpoVT family DNA-binding domain-containing protein [Paenibacillus sp. GCM10027626]|uniref:AbrB/MazE/SpoVT family DNA-binding domain-containing protein n=1 Tax=Paenibacillus sp. GCM10027626 TaxID=3273411 RepID=UPI00363DFBB5